MVGNFPEKSTGETNKQLEYPIPMKFPWELAVGGATHFTAVASSLQNMKRV